MIFLAATPVAIVALAAMISGDLFGATVIGFTGALLGLGMIINFEFLRAMKAPLRDEVECEPQMGQEVLDGAR